MFNYLSKINDQFMWNSANSTPSVKIEVNIFSCSRKKRSAQGVSTVPQDHSHTKVEMKLFRPRK